MTTTSSSSAAIPLTTEFAPPASCSSLSWVSSDCMKSTCDGVYNIVRTPDTDCFPSGWATTQTWFSPGYYCPTGYTVDKTDIVTSGLGITETQAKCCPEGFAIATKSPLVWYTAEPCTAISSGATTITYTVLGATPTTTTAITYRNPIVHAYPIELRWQSTDHPDPAITSSVTETSPASSATSTTSTTSTAAADNTSGLSPGAKAGIGAGVAVAAISVIALALLFWFRQKRSRKSSAQAPDGSVRDGPAFKKTVPSEPVELPTHSDPWTPELHGDFSPMSELGSDRVCSERGYSARTHSERAHSEYGQI
ncbi:uncharacterized protein N7482_005703 [Penicillium canariense]|uniref:Uncharacterized protein n=1 Tax=Penicillium canariense TaxID=189055 RepID=A0A9W9I8J2_9EURO|nr:uncharacterized protein N7482_005703 [Penicillium canariense]KAJ5166922.1 hypothetical protein N7482_005703 [Penicillium canariense]